jgi:hypothetical protein
VQAGSASGPGRGDIGVRVVVEARPGGVRVAAVELDWDACRSRYDSIRRPDRILEARARTDCRQNFPKDTDLSRRGVDEHPLSVQKAGAASTD